MQQQAEQQGVPRHRASVASEVPACVDALLQSAGRAPAVTSQPMLPLELREAILVLCSQARAERWAVERVIVMLKHRWAALPEIRRLPQGGDHDLTLRFVIAQCIVDYYSDRDHGHPVRVARQPLDEDRGAAS